MLVDGQDSLARKFLSDSKMIGQLIDWSTKQPDMIGVNSEASRLIAWILKNSLKSRVTDESTEMIANFVKIEGSVEVLVEMLVAAHLIMQNEALIGLSLLSSYSKTKDELNGKLISANVGQKLGEFIQRIGELDRTTNEIVDNLRTLLSIYDKSEVLKAHLSEHNLAEKLKTLPSIQELATL